MNWNTLYCPNKTCRYYGIPFQAGKMVKNGSSYGQPQALCKDCGGSVALSYATAYYGLESEAAIFETAVRALAEGNSIRATGRIVQIDKDTVCAWLHRAALHCRAVALYFWSQWHVTECQLDELWGFVHTKEAHLPGAKIYSATYGDAWVWLASGLAGSPGFCGRKTHPSERQFAFGSGQRRDGPPHSVLYQ